MSEINFLVKAAELGLYDVVYQLLKEPVDEIDCRGEALFLAVYRQHWDVAELLVKSGADVNYKTLNGHTALMVASEYNNVDIVSLLISHSAELNNECINGSSALSLANSRSASHGSDETVQIIECAIEHKAILGSINLDEDDDCQLQEDCISF